MSRKPVSAAAVRSPNVRPKPTVEVSGETTPAAGKTKAASRTVEKSATVNTAKKPAASKSRKASKPRRPPARGIDVAEIFRRFHAIEAEPQGELEHSNPYTLLVAVVLSAQATDRGVNIATRPLFAKADTPAKMLALGEDTVRDAIKTIGLYRNKAKNVIALSQKLIDDHDGEVPEDRDALEALPGVGRKTANVVMNMAFGHPTMAVDTHVFRLAHRLGLSNGKDPLEVEQDLLAVIPEQYAQHAHHWLILHGRYLCKARKPECWRCTVKDICPFKTKTEPPN